MKKPFTAKLKDDQIDFFSDYDINFTFWVRELVKREVELRKKGKTAKEVIDTYLTNG